MNICEVCTKAVTGPPVRVGACEFPFYIHDECRPAMAEVASSIEAMCAWSASQPDGLLHLGSWTSDHNAVQERTS
jgi:hypothetical protein